MTPFQLELRAQIYTFIAQAKQEGTVAMSVENLMQCVKAPNITLEGAPKGTNARYFYAEMFRELCANDNVIRRFIAPLPFRSV